MTTLQPLADRIIIKALGAEKTSPLGIIIPDMAAKEKPGMGTVIAVGPGKTDESGNVIPVKIEVGDVVVFSKYSPDEVEIDGEKLLIVKEESVLAVVK